MSTPEDRAHDADVDARTACPECRAQGIASSLADCPGHPADTLPDPDTLDLTHAIRHARYARQVAATIREDAPYATAEKIAELFEERAEHCDSVRDRIVERMGGGS